MGKNGSISSRIRNSIRVFNLSTLVQYSASILSQSNKVRKRNTRDRNKKGRSQIIPICKW
jgi:hypothetical protein